jgi:triphosphoribosyl-dephospho-CoA synthetase
MLEPKHIARFVQISMAIEPVPIKEGLTTRYKDIVDTLKLEYFIVGAINSGLVIEELMNRKKGEVTYDLLFKSTVKFRRVTIHVAYIINNKRVSAY